MRYGYSRPTIGNRHSTQYRPAVIESEVMVPLVLSVVTGAILVIVWTWLWWVWPDGWPLQPSLELDVPLFLVGFVFVWAWRLTKHDDMLIAGVERAQNKPVHYAESQEKRFTTWLEVNQQSNDSDAIIHVAGLSLPVSPDVFASFARAAVNGVSLSESAWAGQGKPMTAGDSGTYRQVKKTLLHCDPALLHYASVGGKRRLAPTDDGKTVFAQFIKLYDQNGEESSDTQDEL